MKGKVMNSVNPKKPEGAVETWMTDLDDEMQRTLHQITK